MAQGRKPRKLYMFDRGCNLIRTFNSCEEASIILNINMRTIRVAACQECAARRDDEFFFSFRDELEKRDNTYVRRWNENKIKRLQRKEKNEFGIVRESVSRKCNLCDKVFDSFDQMRTCPDCKLKLADEIDPESVYGGISKNVNS